MPNVRSDVVARLAARDNSRTEADLQADIYALLTTAGLQLSADQVARLEVPTKDGTRRRLDVEIGHAVIEVKRDLRPQAIRDEAERQLAGYVSGRMATIGSRYVGILTDGTDWHLYHLENERLALVSTLKLNAAQPDSERLSVWLESILATETAIPPVPMEINRRLGADSPAHLLDHASLRSLYESASHRAEVRLKRELWAKLLRTAFGKSFNDDAELFVDHTLLVLSAEVIAHAVMGFDVTRSGSLTAQSLVRGTAFTDSQIYGVVEADFFDWIIEIDGGAEFVAELADRIGRFDWGHVEHDVLKVLYESIIPVTSRTGLGEYYTPDWLADRIVDDAVAEPLIQRVLDPACGSGTFLFHAIRRYFSAASEAGIGHGDAVRGAIEHVYGMDVHPVAVTLARVTYLLAIGRERLLAEERPAINIPVYLGDSVQWEQHLDLFGGVDAITVSTSGDDLVTAGGGTLFGDDLVFPRTILEDASRFDQLVTAFADKARETSGRKSGELISPTLRRFGVHEEDVPTLTATFDTMRRLHQTGRDHIWGYYVRNLIRPLWLSEKQNRADVVVGNPPWLRYSKMTATMQERYKRLSKDRGLLTGGLGASGRDLSTLFAVRVVELYLKPSGTFSLVMPHGTLGRQPHDGFRSGSWGSTTGTLAVKFDRAWDLSNATTGFPMVACVVRGRRATQPSRLPPEVRAWAGRLRMPNSSWAAIADKIHVTDATVLPQSQDSMSPVSAYKRRFRQGAVLAPRMLLFVQPTEGGPLGPGAGRLAVESRRNNLEKEPWRSLPNLVGTVEKTFLRRIFLGESVLPFRTTEPLTAVLPLLNKILDEAEIDSYPALSQWWGSAEGQWEKNKQQTDSSSLLDRIDYHGQLSSQLPTASHRVVYTKAGNKIAAARLTESSGLVDTSLYWCAASSADEALFLIAVLNSDAVMDRVRPLQTLGLFGARHIDKYVFNVPIPTYDRRNDDHVALVALASRAEAAAATMDLSAARDFKRARSEVRAFISAISVEIDEIVLRIIAPGARP